MNTKGQVDVLAALGGVVRIAKAASIGVSGNGPRIERAEQAIVEVAELVERARKLAGNDFTFLSGTAYTDALALRAALARFGGES